jgi:hypothetical protein
VYSVVVIMYLNFAIEKPSMADYVLRNEHEIT